MIRPTRISHLLKLGVRKIQYANNNQLPGRKSPQTAIMSYKH